MAMPTVEEFEAAALQLDDAAKTTATLIDPVRAAIGGNIMVGGQLTGLVTDELDAAAKLLEQTTTELTELAATCRERAEAGRSAAAEQQVFAASYADYESDLRRWREEGEAGPAPDPPVQPPAGSSWL